jgi:hypothetical protein
MRTRLSFLAICSLLLSLLTTTTAANSLTANLEVIAVTDSKPGEVELTFFSRIASKSLSYYQITAKPKSGVGLTFTKRYTKKASGYITHKISPLSPEVDYIFTITATTNKNRVIRSAPYNYLVSSTVPSTPLITKVEATDADEAVVFFTAPKDDGGTPIYYYTITSNPGAISVIAPIQGSGSVTISGLTKATTYTFTLTAHNINGSSRAATSPAPITTLAEKIVRVSPTSSSSNAPTLAAPAFTLSSSSQSVIVNTAITTVTNTSTGGAISSYSISPAAPAGLTFSTSTGQLSGTPTSIQSATAYTITATNAAGSATRTFTLTVTNAPTKLVISRASIGTTAGVAFSTQPQITIQDANSETVTASSAVVTATISTGGGLVGTRTATAVSGVATFDNLGIRGWGSTSYTITYSVSGLTSATQSITTASAYLIGSTGPGGGVIYYRSSSGWTCGLALDEKCYYLEVAPPALGLASWDTDTVNSVSRTWAQSPHQTTAVPDFGDRTNAQLIGYGYRNTQLIINQGNSDSTTSAAALAQSFRGGGFSDWFLPSRTEGFELCKWHQTGNCDGNAAVNQNQGTGATGFVRGPYWTSSELSATEGYSRENRQGGHQGGGAKSSTALVRPIRAF